MIFSAMQNRLGRNRYRKNVGNPLPKVLRTRILIGLPTGKRKEAVSAMNVQANIKGMTGNRRRVTRAYTTGVRINAVASFDRNAVMTVPAAKTAK